MKPAHVHQRLIAIATLAKSGDDEAANSAENRLFFDVLEAIAAGEQHPRTLARLAIKSRQV